MDMDRNVDKNIDMNNFNAQCTKKSVENVKFNKIQENCILSAVLCSNLKISIFSLISGTVDKRHFNSNGSCAQL
jgi:hypothetical protein